MAIAPAGYWRPAPGGLCAALVSRRRALSRDQPVTDTTSSSIRPFVRLSAARNDRAYLVVISARDVIDNPLFMPLPRSPLRGHSYVRHGERFAGSFRESRRVVALPVRMG